MADMRIKGKNRDFQDKLAYMSLPALLKNIGFHTVTVSPFGERHSAWWFYAGFNEVYNPGKSGLERADEVVPQRVYNFYKRKNFGFVQFIPVIEPYEEYNISHPYSLKPKEYAYFLKVLFDNWERDLIKGKYISIRLFDNLVRMIGGYPPQACEMNGMCSIQNVIEADGSIYPCDFYVFEKYKLGNINEIKNMEEILKNETAKNFITSSLELPDECRNCEWYSLCRNGCKRYRYDGKKYYFCNAYKEFFEYSYERLKKISENTPIFLLGI